jgi:transcriptional regulator GlxA family with amidase domain
MSTLDSSRRASRVAVLVFDECSLFETSVPLSVFGVDRTDTGAPGFTTRPVSLDAAPLNTTTGLQLTSVENLRWAETAGVVIVPTWRDTSEVPAEPVLAMLRKAHKEGALVVGLCLGAFVLAAAGILDGRRAATHWRHADKLSAMYPDVDVDSAVLYVDEGQVITSAGTAAGLDACLHIVRREYSADSAAAIARRMVVSPHRSGGQAQFIETPVPKASARNELSEVLAWALDNLDQRLDVEALSRKAHMSRRNFDRRFRELNGSAPLEWLLHQRVIRAQQLLEHTDLPIDHVANKVGFSSGVSLRPHFRRTVGVSPQQYRSAFRAASSEPDEGSIPTQRTVMPAHQTRLTDREKPIRPRVTVQDP